MSQGPIAVVGAPAAETEEDSTITDALNDSRDTLQSSDVGDDTERISATRPGTIHGPVEQHRFLGSMGDGVQWGTSRNCP